MKHLIQSIVLFLLSCNAVAEMKMYFVHSDHLGTPQMLTDADQKVVWKVESQTPFGEVEVNEDPDEDGNKVVYNIRFPGQYYDQETNTNYNYFRTYDPSLGRYLQSDPIGLAGGINTYGYVGGNPVNYIDPTGEVAIADDLLVVGALTLLGGCIATNCTKPLTDALEEAVEDIKDKIEELCEDDECDPPAGTICSVFHETGAPHKATDIDGNSLGKTIPHVHTYQMNPSPNGCQWNKRGAAKHTHNFTPLNARSCHEYPSWVKKYGR